MERLTAAIVEVAVPEQLSVSVLGSSEGCVLKLIVASMPRSESVDRLALGPEAAIGTLLHRVFERAHRDNDIAGDRLFEEEYTRIVDELARDGRRKHFADLDSTKSSKEWAQIRAGALRRVEDLRLRRGTKGWSSRAKASRASVGAEITLESTALRLRGRADNIRQLGPALFEIRDFKTGATLDHTGEVKPEIALQLRAYGLLLMESRPGVEVRLLVDDGLEREVRFDEETERASRETIERIIQQVPPPGRAFAEDLATPGRACWGCTVRHVCPAYRVSAPRWWKHYPAHLEQLSNDVWGTVTDVLPAKDGTDVVMRDDAGRRDRIDGLSDRLGISVNTVGSRLWFFGLQANGVTRGFDGTRFHPRSFHDRPRDSLERRAWALHVFVEN